MYYSVSEVFCRTDCVISQCPNSIPRGTSGIPYIASRSEDTGPGNLVLISSIANQLLEASAATATQASEQALAQLVERFDPDYSVLRYRAHDLRASVLAAEWPPRPDVADPDPFAVIPFTSDPPALSLCDNGKELVRIHRRDDGVSRWPLRARRSGAPMVAAAPLISGTKTCGVLGFVKCRGRKWKPEAIHTLTTIASLFAQFR